MLGGEGAVLRQSLGIAIQQHTGVRQFAPALGGVGKQRADAAVNIDPAVGTGGAGGGGKRVKLFLAVHQRQAKRLQHRGPFMERHAAQRRTGLLPTIGKGAGKIDAARIDEGDGRTGRGVKKRNPFPGPRSPAAADIAFEPARPGRQNVHSHFLPVRSVSAQTIAPQHPPAIRQGVFHWEYGEGRTVPACQSAPSRKARSSRQPAGANR